MTRLHAMVLVGLVASGSAEACLAAAAVDRVPLLSDIPSDTTLPACRAALAQAPDDTALAHALARLLLADQIAPPLSGAAP